MRSPSVRKVWIEIRLTNDDFVDPRPSPSVRKVWIEIVLSICTLLPHTVTFCEEGVD